MSQFNEESESSNQFQIENLLNEKLNEPNVDDPNQWTWLPNEIPSKEEIDILLLQSSHSGATSYSPQSNLKSGYEDFTPKEFKNSKTISNKKFSFPKENFTASNIRASILIPEKYLPTFQSKIIEHHGIRAYLAYLLNKYRIHIANGIVPVYSNLTTKYQEKDQCLKKIGFRPLPADWAELKLYRVSFGMSISAFFVYLLIADSTEFAQTVSSFLWKVGVPPVPMFDLAAKLYLCENRDFYTAIFQFREGIIS